MVGLKNHLFIFIILLSIFSTTKAQFQADEHFEIVILLKDTCFTKVIIYRTLNADYYFDGFDFINDPDIRLKNRLIRKIEKEDSLIINKFMKNNSVFNFGIIMFIVKKINSGLIIIKENNGNRLHSLNLYVTEKKMDHYSWWSIFSYRTPQKKELFSYGSTKSSRNLK